MLRKNKKPRGDSPTLEPLLPPDETSDSPDLENTGSGGREDRILRYRRIQRRLLRLQERLLTRFSAIAGLRFGSFALIPGLPLFRLYAKDSPVTSPEMGLWAAPGLIAFLVFLFLHFRVREKLAAVRDLLAEYAACLTRLGPDWSEKLPCSDPADLDIGDRDSYTDHSYGRDLDILGKFSLFQYLDRSSTREGGRTLARLLLSQPDETARDPEEFRLRSQAVRELSRNRVFRSRFRRAGGKARREEESFSRISPEDLSSHTTPALNRILIWPARILPPITLASYILAAYNPAWAYYLLTLPLQFLLFLLAHYVLGDTVRLSSRVSREINGFERMFRVCDKTRPRSEYLNRIGIFRESPGRAVKQLSFITGLFTLRSNPIAHALLGVFFLHEVHLTAKLESWLTRYADRLPEWEKELAELDALLCLSEFAADHPRAVFPELSTPAGEKNAPLFEARALAHPLLGEKRNIGNDVRFDEHTRLWLISGSNMSGKSTFLRTVGINLVLAMAGAPVFAASFRFQSSGLFTSLQQTDDLHRSISLFYAEVRRMKALLDRAQDAKKTPFFYLVDEAFRGTNTRERQIAARAVLRRLREYGARGMITTHDLDLLDEYCGREPEILCKHFQETILGSRMSFDYLLREGPVQGTNALRILEMEGISLE